MSYATDMGNSLTESTFGTAVTDTARLMAVTDCKITPTNNAQVFEEMRGSLAGAFDSALTEIGAAGSITMRGNYQDVCYFLESLFGTATPTGAGPYVRTGSAPTTAVPSRRMMTIVYGDGTNIYKGTSMIVTKLTIKGAAKQPMTVTADLIGYSVTTGTFASLSDRTIATCMGNQATLSVDAWGGTVGTTALSAMAWEYTLTLDSGAGLEHFLGALTPGAYHDGASWKGSLDLNLKLNTTSKAYLDNIVGGTALEQRQVRISYTTGASAILRFDFAGTLEKAPDLFDYRDDVTGIKLSYTRQYNTTLGNWFAYSSTNSVSALP